MTQAGTTESIRVSTLDPDGDQVTVSVSTSMFGVDATVSDHVVTYTAPSGQTGQDSIPVTAEDGKGGSANCEIAVLVQDANPTPTPSPTSASPTPTSSQSASQPVPTTSAPAPTGATATKRPIQAPTSQPAPTGSDAPTPRPTSAPPAQSGSPTSAASTQVPGTVDHGNDDDTGWAGSDGNGSGGTGHDSGTATPKPAAPGMTSPDGTGSSRSGQPGSTSGAEGLRNIVNAATVEVPLRAVSDAERLIKGISAGMTARHGGGNFPDRGSNGKGQSSESPSTDNSDAPTTEPMASVHRTADTGSSVWLFAAVGLMLIVLIGLALVALPSRRRRH